MRCRSGAAGELLVEAHDALHADGILSTADGLFTIRQSMPAHELVEYAASQSRICRLFLRDRCRSAIGGSIGGSMGIRAGNSQSAKRSGRFSQRWSGGQFNGGAYLGRNEGRKTALGDEAHLDGSGFGQYRHQKTTGRQLGRECHTLAWRGDGWGVCCDSKLQRSMRSQEVLLR